MINLYSVLQGFCVNLIARLIAEYEYEVRMCCKPERQLHIAGHETWDIEVHSNGLHV